jgi:UDPglucose 6-dehydrogenase
VRLIETTVAINDSRKRAMSRKVVEACGGDVRDKTIAVLGLTFKPNTDDMRDAPSLDIIPALQAKGARVQAFDPEGMHEAEKMLKDVAFCAGPYEAAEGADAIVIVTEWDQFRALDFNRLRLLMKAPVLIDLRNVYRPEDMRGQGFEYTSIGRRGPRAPNGLRTPKA